MAAPHDPPSATPASVEIYHQQQKNNMEDVDMLSTIPNQPNEQAIKVSSSQITEAKKNNQPVKNPEVARTDPQEATSSPSYLAEENRDLGAEEEDDPRNPLNNFDWSDFEARYRQAMSEASDGEQALRDDFDGLVQYFGVWASAASQYDNDRSLKRIKTRRLYVQHAEQSLEQKRVHYTKVVEAFQNALSLLGNS